MRRQLLMAMGLLMVFTSVSSAAIQWEILESDSRHLHLRLQVEGGQLEEFQPDQFPYSTLEIEGTRNWGEPGLPAIPACARWFLMPPRGDVRMKVLGMQTEFLGNARLLPGAVPEFQREEGMQSPRLKEYIRELPGYDSFSHDAADVASLGEAVFSRRQRMIPLRIRPVLYEASTGRVEVVRSIELELIFEEQAPRADSADLAPSADSSLLSAVLNPDQASGWRCLSPEQQGMRDRALQKRLSEPVPTLSKRLTGILPQDQVSLLSDEYRLRVDKTGLWRLELDDILDLGFPEGISRSQLRLYQKRPSDPDSPQWPVSLTVDVPFTFLDSVDPQGEITRSDVLVFHALDVRDDSNSRLVEGEVFPKAMRRRADNYNSENVYYLVAADPGEGGSWERMDELPVSAAEGDPRSYFQREAVFELDAGFQDNPVDVRQPRYHWNDLAALELSHNALPVEYPVNGQQMEVEWSIIGPNEATSAIYVRSFLEVGGLELDLETVNVSLSSFDTLTVLTRAVSTDVLVEDHLNFQMEHLDNLNNQQALGCWLGHVALSYPSYYRATADRAYFHGGLAGGDASLEINGFTRSDLLGFDLTDPHAPGVLQLSAENILEVVAGEWKVSLQISQEIDQPRHFAILPSVRIDRIRSDQIQRDSIPDILESCMDHQVFAIGPAGFSTPMESWVDWRSQHDLFGWNYCYVDVQQIYDHFSGGLKSSDAIRAFAEYMYLISDARAIMLVGDANENAREIQLDSLIDPPPDHVPAPLHIQDYAGNELLASDKWYGLFGLTPLQMQRYPQYLNKVPDMLVGRLAVNSTAELETILSKILAYEQPSDLDSWRRRTLWVADDAHSTDYLGAGQDVYCLHGGELQFASSQIRSSAVADSSVDGELEGTPWLLNDLTQDLRVGTSCEDGGESRGTVSMMTQQSVTPVFLDKISEGWLMVSYQGHAAFNVLSHETFFQAINIPNIRNQGRPFLFFGMGCHASDFIGWRESRLSPSLGEMLVSYSGGGAIASYGSTGFEFLGANKNFMEAIADNFFATGRVIPATGDESLELPSQWVLGEQLLQSDLDILGVNSSYNAMMSQYILLGDPLLRMDAAPPRLKVTADGAPLENGQILTPSGESRQIALAFEMNDESGISALRVEDSLGRSYALPGFEPAGDPRMRNLDLELPVHAQGYRLDLSLYDGSYPDQRPTTLSLEIPFEIAVFVDGGEVQEGTGSFDIGAHVSIRVEFTAPVSLAEGEISVSMDGADLSGVIVQSMDASGRSWRVEFQAEGATSDMPQAIRLLLAGDETLFALTAEAQPKITIGDHYPFPNPFAGEVRFIASTTGIVDWTRLSVYDVAGNTVFSHTWNMPANGSLILPWDGRDERGDELANGVYFYHLEIGGSAGRARSTMGRLVMMR